MIRIPSDRQTVRDYLFFIFNKDRIQSERRENRAETYGDMVRGSHPNLVERQAGCRPRIKSGEMSSPSRPASGGTRHFATFNPQYDNLYVLGTLFITVVCGTRLDERKSLSFCPCRRKD